MIAILCPTYRRPLLCKRMVESAKVDVYLGTDSVDIFDYKNADIHPYDYIHCHPNMPTAHKWNMLAIEAMKNPDNKLFMLGADDMYFETDGWDTRLIEEYNKLDNKIHVFALKDSRDPEGTPHPIFTREWIEFWGYMVNPMWLHWFVDTWAVTIAKANNCFMHLKEYSLVHLKPSDIGKADVTHTRIRSWGWADRDKFVWDNSQEYLEFDKQRLAKVFA